MVRAMTDTLLSLKELRQHTHSLQSSGTLNILIPRTKILWIQGLKVIINLGLKQRNKNKIPSMFLYKPIMYSFLYRLFLLQFINLYKWVQKRYDKVEDDSFSGLPYSATGTILENVCKPQAQPWGHLVLGPISSETRKPTFMRGSESASNCGLVKASRFPEEHMA